MPSKPLICPSNPTCEACDLHVFSLSHPCTPTVWFPDSPLEGPRCLLVVGENPGSNEDREGAPFVGQAGAYLKDIYLRGVGLSDLLPVYLSNAVRCRTAGNSKPNSGPLTSCRRYLEADVALLATRHPEVIILCAGTTATQQILHLKLTAALRQQLVDVELGGITCKVFSTYHPGFLFDGRNPSAIESVGDHLQMLIDYLTGDYLPSAADAPTLSDLLIAPSPPAAIPGGILSLDIETYGCVACLPEQNYYHPLKSLHLDGIPKEDLIQTVSLTWPHPDDPDLLQSGVFEWRRRPHRRILRQWLGLAAHTRTWLLGMNIVFDLLYQRACDPVLRSYLSPDSGLLLMDLAVISYLHSELRPERSLKSLAPLFGFTTYDKERMGTYTSSSDPDLWVYNARDSWATYRLVEYLSSRIHREYRDTAKLSPYCLNWYSRLLWSILQMTEYGVAFDPLALDRARVSEETACANILSYGYLFGGKGSKPYIQELVEDAVTAVEQSTEEGAIGMEVHGELERTTVRNDISTGDHNIRLLLRHLPPDSSCGTTLEQLQDYRSHNKVLTSYLRPILIGRGKNKADKASNLLSGICYPSWYAVPTSQKDARPSEGEGGTRQSRLAAKQPAIQTCPISVKDCMVSRYPRGVLIGADLSQIELRMAALLSADPRMMHEYELGLDKHAETAKACFGPSIVDAPDFHVWRQVGKQVNFLILYGGGAKVLRATVMKKVGVDLSLSRCKDILRSFRNSYPRLMEWQSGLILEAQSKGYLELLLIGQSHLFRGSAHAVESASSEIKDFPVQTLASNVLQSAQSALQDAFRARALHAGVTCQIHDAIYIDCPTYEQPFIYALLDPCLKNPPFYQDLCDRLGRTVPLDYSLSILSRTHKRLNNELKGKTHASTKTSATS